MKLSKKYKYLKFLQPFDEKSYTNSDILFSIKQYQPLLNELFTEQDDSIYPLRRKTPSFRSGIKGYRRKPMNVILFQVG